MPEPTASPDLLSLAFSGAGAIAVLAVLAWCVATLRHDVSLVDRVWGPLIALGGITYFNLLPAPGTRATWMLVLGVIWALRLSLYITARNWGHGEDRRYQEIRARNEPHFGLKSLYLIFGLQAVLAWAVSAPFLPGMAAATPIGGLDVAGFALAAVGMGFEAIGDTQMARFKADPANGGQVMDRGLWRYTRHPNYFGEFCIWWGLWIVAVAGAGPSALWTIVSPVVMSVLLLKVSGVTVLEKDITERRPAYRDYVRRTNTFFPGPRKPEEP